MFDLPVLPELAHPSKSHLVDFVRQLKPAIEGQGGDIWTYKVCCMLVKDKKLDEATALELLSIEWNPRCQPPWDLSDLKQKIQNANAYGKSDLKNPETQDSKESEGFQFIQLKDLLLMPEEEVPWVVEGILISGGTSIFSGKPKAGKTTLARQAALQIAQGKPFLGRKVAPGPVLYLALEEKLSQIKKHFEEMGADSDTPLFIHAARAPTDFIAQLKSAVEQYRPVLVVVDTLFKATKVKDNNSYSEVIGALEPLEEIARTTGAHVLTVHHMNKSEREGTDSLLGSQGIGGAFDTLVFINRSKEGQRTIETIQRYGEDLKKSELTFDKDSRLTSLGDLVEEKKSRDTEEEIINILKSSRIAVDFQAIETNVTGAKPRIRGSLNDLVKKGAVERLGRGTKGDPFKYFLKPEVDDF